MSRLFRGGNGVQRWGRPLEAMNRGSPTVSAQGVQARTTTQLGEEWVGWPRAAGTARGSEPTAHWPVTPLAMATLPSRRYAAALTLRPIRERWPKARRISV